MLGTLHPQIWLQLKNKQWEKVPNKVLTLLPLYVSTLSQSALVPSSKTIQYLYCINLLRNRSSQILNNKHLKQYISILFIFENNVLLFKLYNYRKPIL